jgi:hypothetical protein
LAALCKTVRKNGSFSDSSPCVEKALHWWKAREFETADWRRFAKMSEKLIVFLTFLPMAKMELWWIMLRF